MFRIITAFDNVHLDGTHYPSVRVGLSRPTLESAFEVYNSFNYSLEHYVTRSKIPITFEYLQRHYNTGRTYISALDADSEGYIIIIEN